MSENINQTLFTCLSCSIAFLSAEEQRLHYRSDHHRYNMKRRIASLPPVSAAVFDQKVLDRRAETAVMSSLKGSTCDVCKYVKYACFNRLLASQESFRSKRKVYTSENAYRSHIQSKKHKEAVSRAASKPEVSMVSQNEFVPETHEQIDVRSEHPLKTHSSSNTNAPKPIQDVSQDDITQTIDDKISAARSRLSLRHCLFCPQENPSFEESLTHMSLSHSFFIPDADYLTDVTGLISYLGEKIAVGNVCIYCNDKGKEFRTLDAVRKHMQDKSHCKVAYESEDDRLELSDYYDFTTSYADSDILKSRKTLKSESDVEVWEDVPDVDDDEADEIVEESPSDSDSVSDDGSETLPDNQLTYGDSIFELVLPSGARIGHRTMRRYYAQSFPGADHTKEGEDPNSGKALVRRLLADKNSALVPRKGGFGAFGHGTEVVKARNRGEAREAGRHVREFRDQKRREDFRTRVGFIHNSQKHFRDPLLQ